MNNRYKLRLMREGKKDEVARIEKNEKLAINYLEDMQKQNVTLNESKIIVNKMACILEKSEKYRPETPLNEISLRNT